MSQLTKALYESFHIDEDFAEEVAEVADNSVEDNKDNIDESLNESIWDKVAPLLEESATLKESSEIGKAIDEYQKLLRQDIPPAKARAIVTGEKEEVQESLNESSQVKKEMTVKEKYDPKSYMKKVCEKYRTEAKFGLDEELTEEKLKNEDWRIKNVAMRASIPSSKLKEALLENVKEN